MMIFLVIMTAVSSVIVKGNKRTKVLTLWFVVLFICHQRFTAKVKTVDTIF